MTPAGPDPPPSDRRQAPRFNISLPVWFTIAPSGKLCAGMVDNISLGGVLLLTDEPLVQETRITLHVPIAVDATVNIEAAVVRTSDLGEVGVAFIALGDEAMQRLRELVEERSRRRSQDPG
jgi:hypothetical protein